MNVYGRLWMAPRAGFEIARKLLCALVLQVCDEASTPNDTPRIASLGWRMLYELLCARAQSRRPN